MPTTAGVLIQFPLYGAIASLMTEAEAGKTVAIQGFGRFAIKDRPARPGRNPRTGEPMEVAASRTLVFKAAKSST